jgi:predicted amidohydrolase
MRIALAQTSPRALEVDANLAASAALIASAADRGAALTVFPELSVTGYELDGIAATPSAWLTVDDARLDGVRAACVAGHTAAILGAPWRDAQGRPRLAAVIVHADGTVHASAKQYLHGREHDVFVADAPAPPFELDGWRVAVAVCFDVAHPAHAAQAAAQAADLYVGSSLYVVGQERRSDLHFGARAMDHRMFAALANHAGTSGGYTSFGGSGAWRPSGDLLCRAGTAPELLLADLDRAELDAFRS